MDEFKTSDSKAYKTSRKTYAYDSLITIGNILQDFVLLILRLYWGYAFQMAGLNKFANVASSAEFFSSLHLPFPELAVYLVAIVEFIGGWCLILGFASRLASIPLIIIMIVALFMAHSLNMSTFLDPGAFTIQSPVSYLIVTLIILAFGPGRISLDFLLEKLFFRRGKN